MTERQLKEQEENIRQQWRKEQIELKNKLILHDQVNWSPRDIRYIAGVDISFFKNNSTDAISSLVVLSYPDCKVVYESYKVVQLTLPYIPCFLGFREVPYLVELVQEIKEKAPQFYPDVILVDGNGILHPLGFGVACHLGVLTDMVTIGVAKNLLFIDGITREKIKEWSNEHLLKGGDSFDLIGDSDIVHGAILRATDEAKQPIYISVGHKICLKTALDIVRTCCLYRIPEPIRQADLRSRALTVNK